MLFCCRRVVVDKSDQTPESKHADTLENDYEQQEVENSRSANFAITLISCLNNVLLSIFTIISSLFQYIWAKLAKFIQKSEKSHNPNTTPEHKKLIEQTRNERLREMEEMRRGHKIEECEMQMYYHGVSGNDCLDEGNYSGQDLNGMFQKRVKEMGVIHSDIILTNAQATNEDTRDQTFNFNTDTDIQM